MSPTVQLFVPMTSLELLYASGSARHIKTEFSRVWENLENNFKISRSWKYPLLLQKRDVDDD